MSDDRLHHISEFLDFFAGPASFLELEPEGLALDRYHYAAPPESPALDAQIRQLRGITRSLGERLPPPVSLPPNLHIDYAAALNSRQLQAVTCTSGPLLVIAGAGSGKTRTLIYRLSYLLEAGVTPAHVLLLTFTRRAAAQMLERAQRLRPGSGTHEVMGGTFHSFCAWLLRRLAPLAGMASNFTIIDTVDGGDIIDLICQELKLRTKDKAFPRKGRIQEIISQVRNSQLPLETVLEREHPDLRENYADELALISRAFAAYKLGNQLMDYDDLLEVTRDRLRDSEAFARKARSFFSHVMVDEYQDTNLLQKQITDALAAEHRNLMVVGDDAQSIYGFRGAHFENILRFPETWPDAHLVKLEQNYRSTQPILNLSNAIIASNRLGFPKRLFSERKEGPLPRLSRLYSAEDEAIWIVDQILQRHPQIPFVEMAVLYRAGFHSNFLQAELIKRRIPFVVYGGIRFTERRHIKDMVAYLRILLNPLDALAWHRLLQLLPGIGKVSARQILEQLRAHQGSLDPAAFGKKKFTAALTELRDVLERAKGIQAPAGQLELIQAHYVPLLQGVESDYLTRLPDLEVLITLADKYEKLDKFLTDFALDPPSQKFLDRAQPTLEEPEEKPLVLSSVHSAKGLEWKLVFVMHLLDGLFPSSRVLKNLPELEEERRLFYVACSRAADELLLSLPAVWSSYQQVFTQPSRFLAELPEQTYEIDQVKHR